MLMANTASSIEPVQLVIEPILRRADSFKNGLAKVYVEDADGWKAGYINQRGDYVWKPTN